MHDRGAAWQIEPARFRMAQASIGARGFGRPKSKTPELKNSSGGCFDISLTMSYFHTGTRTIIGAEAFHFPVRDGKEWDHLAMVIRLNLSPGRSHERPSQFTEKFESRYMTASTEGQTTFFDLVSKL